MKVIRHLEYWLALTTISGVAHIAKQTGDAHGPVYELFVILAGRA
jgi:hypothetical protein